jgi:hypothetical protein
VASDNPYPLPGNLGAPLQAVLSYWHDLKRAGNEMPFWDDVKPSALPGPNDRLLLVDAFEKPERFRVNTIGTELDRAGGSLRGKFIDELALTGPLEFLRSQCSATVEARAPTFYRHEGKPAYARLLLPMWGDGRIGMLLGAVDLHQDR